MRKRPKITEFKFDQWAEDLRTWIAESVSPFEDDTPEKQGARVQRARHDKLYFMQTYLPHYFYGEFGEFHEEWAGLGDLKDEVVLIAAPREHAKSTFFTFGDLLHDICFESRRFIIIGSDTNNQATGFTLPIRLELEDNPRLKHDFGNLKSSQWARNDFTANGVRVLARGRGEKIRGIKNRQYRPDKFVGDDLENDVNVRNPQLVKELIDWLLKAVIGSLGEGYVFLMVGNLFHPKSVLAQMMAMKDEDETPLYISRIYRAILDEGKETERPLWPAVWTLERLKAKRRKMSTVAFNAEMMNLTGAADSPFPEKWFMYFHREEIPDLALLMVATFVDPSAKNGEANDYKAIITVGLDRAQMVFYCLHAWIRRASIREMFAAAYRQVDAYGGIIGIEENMLEDFLHEAIYNYAREAGRYLPWKPVKHTTQKEGRIIGTLSYLVEHGKLLFQRGHSDQDALMEQLVYILNDNVHDDGPDALEGAVRLLQGQAMAPVAYESVGERRRWAEVRGAF